MSPPLQIVHADAFDLNDGWASRLGPRAIGIRWEIIEVKIWDDLETLGMVIAHPVVPPDQLVL